jgi:ribosomal protein L11 methyltransferase
VASAGDLAPANIVVANILAGPLATLAPSLCALVQPGGQILLAGLLADQVEELRASYAPWIRVESAAHEGDWVLLAGQRPPNPAQFPP